MLHLLVSGCSFTPPQHSWAHRVTDMFPIQLNNRAEFAAGNSLIARNLRFGLYQMLYEQKFNPRDIKVIVMWSSPNRHELFVSAEETPGYERFLEETDSNPKVCNHVERAMSRHPQDYRTAWVKGGGSAGRYNSRSRHPAFKLFQLYYKYFHSLQLGFINTVEQILNTQTLLETTGVDYRMLCWQNIFNLSETDSSLLARIRRKMGRDYFSLGSGHCADRSRQDLVPKTCGQPLLKDFYPQSWHIWEMIDWRKWWFYGDDRVANGGFGEWVIQATDLYDKQGLSSHPSPEAHSLFARQVVAPLISEMFGEEDEKIKDQMAKLAGQPVVPF